MFQPLIILEKITTFDFCRRNSKIGCRTNYNLWLFVGEIPKGNIQKFPENHLRTVLLFTVGTVKSLDKLTNQGQNFIAGLLSHIDTDNIIYKTIPFFAEIIQI